jgi:GntR family transcriptional regulator/MocR family aminotransferase
MTPKDPPAPIYRQVYQWMRLSIQEGRLKAGDRVPAIRSLAVQLGVARGTVDLAYGMLVSEGYLTSRGAQGTYVCVSSPARTTPIGPLPSRSDDKPRAIQWKLPFYPGLPALDSFPRAIWSKVVSRRHQKLQPSDLVYPNSQGDERLRQVLTSYLNVSRGISCDPEQIFVTGGYKGALGLVSRLVLTSGDKVWIEDPGYPTTREVVSWAGAVPIPIPVDGQGLDIDIARREGDDAAMCVVTPANQFPLGVAMSLSRRWALLEWARSRNGWIVEDDYDSEFYYGRRMLPALKSLDRDDRVFYIGTFSKSLFPGLRLGYVVAPLSQTDRFRAACRVIGGAQPSMDQRVVAEFMEEGHFARHLRKMRALYQQRRSALLDALQDELGTIMEFDKASPGLNILGRLKGQGDDAELTRRAAGDGYRPMALSRLAIREDGCMGLVLGFANVPTDQSYALVRDLRRAIGL